ncbi:MAG: hypothetical protein PVSMB4_14800 [Ktedonobacterales bacterium]
MALRSIRINTSPAPPFAPNDCYTSQCACPARHLHSEQPRDRGIRAVMSFGQPAERLWPLTNEPLANRSFADLAELETIQAQRYLAL